MQRRVPTTPVVPGFTPVARKYRHDGWTAERQRAFIAALADTGSVTHAAARINMAPEGAYQLRRQPGAESFRAAWEAAVDHGVQCLADLAIDRAKHGVAVPIMYKGEVVGERRRYNDRLLMWILRHHMPARYGEGARGVGMTSARRDAEAEEERRREQSGAAVEDFATRVTEMAGRMAIHDPQLDLSNCSIVEKLVHIIARLWPREAQAAGDAYLAEIDPDGDRP